MQATKQIENHLTANMNMRKKDIIIANFLGGIAWGVGSVLGASVVVGALIYILNLIGAFTGFSSFLNQFK